MERNEGQEEGDPQESAGSDPLVEEEGDDTELEGTGPEVVALQDGSVEPAHVVGEEVDHLAHSGPGHRTLGEPEGLPVDQGGAGHPDLHADDVDPVEVGVVDDGVEGGHEHHPSAVQVGLHPAHLLGSIGLQLEIEKRSV